MSYVPCPACCLQVALHEGLMAAVSGSDVQLQHRLLEWLLRPVHAKWTSPAWLAQLDSPAAVAAEYMQHEVQNGTSVVRSRWGEVLCDDCWCTPWLAFSYNMHGCCIGLDHCCSKTCVSCK